MAHYPSINWDSKTNTAIIISLDTTTYFMDFINIPRTYILFSLLMSLRLCEIKDGAVIVKINVVYYGVDTMFRLFCEVPI